MKKEMKQILIRLPKEAHQNAYEEIMALVTLPKGSVIEKNPQHRDRVYKTTDEVLPILDPKKVKIEVEVCESDILLRIGKRDWQWDRVTGELVGSGTLL